MEAPVGLLLLLTLQVSTGATSGTRVTSCEACHDNATCLESRRRGAPLRDRTLSCVCDDGFAGDGLDCPRHRICNGTFWSTGTGCVDIDECAAVDPPCLPSRVCQNTPGSFDCLPPLGPTFLPSIQYSQSPAAPQIISGVEGQVRLVNGSISCSGRVEVFHHGAWGTVCDDSWDLEDAQVVCRQLACGKVLSVSTQAHFGQGSGPIWYDDVSCTGREFTLNECRHPGIGIHNCGHSEDAGVVCQVVGSPVRLVNSDNRCAGRVEIYHYGQWGTVCGHGWDLNDATVVCRQLGCGAARSVPPSASFGRGDGPTWLDDLRCSGYEPSISYCSHAGFPVHGCKHSEHASVICELPPSPLLTAELICGQDKLQIGLNWAALTFSGLNPHSGNLAAGNCSRVRDHNGLVWYEVEAAEGACGNMLRINSTHAIYSNILFIYPANNASFSRPTSLPFSCAYPLDTETSLTGAVRPSLKVEDGISGSGTKAKAVMSLFCHSNYTEKYPAGQVTLPVGSPLYVGVSVNVTDPGFAVVLEECYATHSAKPDDPIRHIFIQNKCPTDRQQVSVTESGTSLQARFSTAVFLLPGEHRDIFLHCNLSLCNRRRSFCVPFCTRRRYRSVPSSKPLKPLTIGPIIWDKTSE